MYENRKKYSQNLLKSKQLVKEILEISDIQWEDKDLILEIGPGKGIITQEILKRLNLKSRLIAVEIDNNFVRALKKSLGSDSHIEIVNKDILDYSLPNKRYTVISNLPFYCTSEILRKILDPYGYMEEALLVVQKEAASMFMGEGGNTLKSLMYYPFWDFEILHSFNKTDFNPSPNVDSVLIKITRKKESLIPKSEIKHYFSFIKTISKDRVGEGVWKERFTPKEINTFIKNYGLIKNRGIRIQAKDSILNSFGYIITHGRIQS